MKTKLPEKIRVGGFDIKIKEFDSYAAESRQVNGEFSSLDLTMRIDVSMDIQKILDTFLHELFHAIYYVYGVKDVDNEERTVEGLATGTMQIYRDNPSFLRFVNEITEEMNGEVL